MLHLHSGSVSPDHLLKPLDLSKRIPQPEALVKLPRRSDRTSATHRIRSRCSDFVYESSLAPFSTPLPKRLAHTHRSTGTDAKLFENIVRDAPSPGPSSCASACTIETLSSECSGFGRVECVSSDESNAIEVAPSVPASDATSTALTLPENSSTHLRDSDVLQDSDSLESKNVASTSEAENLIKPPRNGSRSPASSSLSPKTKTKRSRPCRKARASAAKKRKKKKKQERPGFWSPPAFPSHGPEIKLKHASCKDEKREGRGNAFAPFVRMELSACTVVNFEEDILARNPRQPAASPGIVPTTSCLQLGRLGSDSRGLTGQVCCLCGETSNAAGLGDLHGPYHPCGPERITPPAGLLSNGHEDGRVKRTRTSGEIWVHEDCSIWSSGVFLIKGRLYGLEEALQLSQESVCSCCSRGGATLGCFFKGCSSKYHFPCALQTGCVFTEENFTLRCPKHKNKSGLCLNR